MIRHANRDGYAKGLLQASYSGELTTGFHYWLGSADFPNNKLTVTVPPVVETDSSHLTMSGGAGDVTLLFTGLLMIDPRAGLMQRATRWVIRYTVHLTPTRCLDFEVSLLLDYTPRDERYLLCTADNKVEASTPTRMGPWMDLQWWLATRETSMTLDSLAAVKSVFHYL